MRLSEKILNQSTFNVSILCNDQHKSGGCSHVLFIDTASPPSRAQALPVTMPLHLFDLDLTALAVVIQAHLDATSERHLSTTYDHGSYCVM